MDTIVETTLGKVQGVLGHGLIAFKGIPYAEPPIGNLRFRPPQKKTPWSPSTLNATEFGYICPQNTRHQPQNENCLTLNILVPLNVHPNAPTIVFIHGGTFMAGHSGELIHAGDFMVNTTGTIYVTMNYRLGVFGLLDTNNVAMKDQQMAIEWIHDNIRSFGGDPQSVTIFGHSSGAMCVLYHILSKNIRSKGYFQRAVMTGIPMAILYRTAESNQYFSSLFHNNLGCSLNDHRCYLNKTTAEILKAQGATFMIPIPPDLNTRNILPWSPLIDGQDLTDQPLRLLEKGDFDRNISIMWGTTRDEACGFIFKNIKQTIPWWFYEIGVSFYMMGHFSELMRLYPSQSHHDARHLMSLFGSDYFFHCGHRLASEFVSKFQKNVYLFSYQHAAQRDASFSDVRECQSSNSSCHGQELSGFFWSNRFFGISRNDTEQMMMRRMMTTVVEFAKGNGNHQMPRYDKITDEMVSFDLIGRNHTIRNYRKEKCDFWVKNGDYLLP